MDEDPKDEAGTRTVDLPEVEEPTEDAPKRLVLSREVRGWLAGLSALVVAFAAMGLPFEQDTAATAFNALTPSTSKLATALDDAGTPQVCLAVDGPTAQADTNIPAKLAEGLCTATQRPSTLLQPALRTLSADGAPIEYSTPFTVGFELGIAESALLPVVVDETAIQVTISGSGAFLEPCARVEADIHIESTGSPVDVNTDFTVLFPQYYVRPPAATGGSGALQSRMSVEISGIGPSGADLGTWPVVSCLVHILTPYTQGFVPNVLESVATLTSYPPADLVLQLGDCTGSEGTAECLGIVSDLAEGTAVTITGPWDAIRITPSMLYTWVDGSRVDEDKAYVELDPGGRMRADYRSSSFTTSAHLHEADATVRYCASMDVHDVDQWWDPTGNQHLDSDEFCLSVTYVRVAGVAKLDAPCASGLLQAPSANWNGEGGVQCLGAAALAAALVVPGDARPLSVVQTASGFVVVPA